MTDATEGGILQVMFQKADSVTMLPFSSLRKATQPEVTAKEMCTARHNSRFQTIRSSGSPPGPARSAPGGGGRCALRRISDGTALYLHL